MRLRMPVAVFELVGGTAARRRPQNLDVDAAVGVDERAQRQRLPRAGDARDADDPVRAAGGLVDEHPLFPREVVPGQHQRLGQRSPLRRRDRHVAAGERELDRLPLHREQLAGREPRRPAGHRLRFDELDAGEARQLVCELEHPVDLLTRGQRAGDRAHQLGHGERRLLLGQPLAPEYAVGELLELNPVPSNGSLVEERVELAPPEAVLGRACLPLLAQARQVDLLLRLPRRQRRHPRRGEALGAERLHVLEQRLAAGREGADRLLRDADELAHPLDRLASIRAPSRRVSSWRRWAS